MLSGSKVCVVIPCHNEEDGIRDVLPRIPEGVDDVVVVDNNCTDRTAEVAASLGARVVSETRPGYGAAYKAGFRAASGDVVATLDGDGTYPPERIPELVEALARRRLDFISACRFPLSDRRAMPFSNRFGNWVLTLAAGALFFRPLRDSQSGMWVFRRAILPGLKLTSDGMAFSEELKLEVLLHAELRFAEIHIPYAPRIGEVKLRKWRDGWENLVFLARKRFGAV